MAANFQNDASLTVWNARGIRVRRKVAGPVFGMRQLLGAVMPLIAKLQRPLNSASEPWLIYTKGRTRMGHLERNQIPPWVRESLAEKSNAYFSVRIVNQRVEFLALAPDQSW
jgi:hypothetical protein